MKRIVKTLPLITFLAVLLVMMLGCSDPGGGGFVPVVEGDWPYNDVAITTFTGTRWTDGLTPASYIEFTAASVELGGQVSGTSYWAKPTGISGNPTINLEGPHSYEALKDLSASAVEPAAYVYINASKKTGFELYLYKANPGNSTHQRLVVHRDGIFQPREFYLEK